MPHILIVEDEPAMSWALAEGLTDDGYTIDTFRTAEEAWAWLDRGRSDLVISDLNQTHVLVAVPDSSEVIADAR